MQDKNKKSWKKPELTVHGSVEKITAAKAFGFSDALVIIKTVPGGGGTGS